MYDRYFDEASEYGTRETLKRAYALGVASVCDEPDDTAYGRLTQRSADTYDESIVELAYEEGRAKALELEATEESGESIWERLIERPFARFESGEHVGSETTYPELLSGPDTTGPATGPPDRLELPSFLRR